TANLQHESMPLPRALAHAIARPSNDDPSSRRPSRRIDTDAYSIQLRRFFDSGAFNDGAFPQRSRRILKILAAYKQCYSSHRRLMATTGWRIRDEEDAGRRL